jgi:hypothetical protein
MSEYRRPWTPCIVFCVTAACGGGGGATAPTETADAEESQETLESASEAEEQAPPAPVDPCASGTCSKCGEAVCLSGFYCEEAVSACGWLPQCADSPSCECVSKVLTNCECEERDGGVYVSCGS